MSNEILNNLEKTFGKDFLVVLYRFFNSCRENGYFNHYSNAEWFVKINNNNQSYFDNLLILNEKNIADALRIFENEPSIIDKYKLPSNKKNIYSHLIYDKRYDLTREQAEYNFNFADTPEKIIKATKDQIYVELREYKKELKDIKNEIKVAFDDLVKYLDIYFKKNKNLNIEDKIKNAINKVAKQEDKILDKNKTIEKS